MLGHRKWKLRSLERVCQGRYGAGSKFKTLRDEKNMKLTTEKIIGQCPVSTEAGSKYARYMNQNIADKFWALTRIIEKVH